MMSDILMNTWYMAAWGYEISSAPLSRQLLGVNTMFFRKQDGSIAALRDRCPHRFAPLSKGKIINDEVQCPYHGLMFNSSGQCVSSPLETQAPQAVKVQAFPVVEKDNIVWFWPGDREKADASLITDFPYLRNTQDYKHVFGLTSVKAHFELETDNLMDLSHVNMLHPPFAGTLTLSSKFSAKRDGSTVYSNWFTASGNNPPVMEHGPFPTQGGLIDQWIEMRWNPPAAMYLEIVVARAGEPRSSGYIAPATHILTPETENTTHYFWSAALHSDDAFPLDDFRASFIQAFDNEDKPMIETVATQMETTNLLAMKPLLLRTDAGSVLARRVLAEMIANEKKLTERQLAS